MKKTYSLLPVFAALALLAQARSFNAAEPAVPGAMEQLKAVSTEPAALQAPETPNPKAVPVRAGELAEGSKEGPHDICAYNLKAVKVKGTDGKGGEVEKEYTKCSMTDPAVARAAGLTYFLDTSKYTRVACGGSKVCGRSMITDCSGDTCVPIEPACLCINPR